MPSSARLDRPSVIGGFVPVLLANLVPLVGVVRLQWDPATLVTLYTLELLFSFPMAAARVLFAQRPPRTDTDAESSVLDVSSDLAEKRGSVRVASWLPPVYPRALPFASRTAVAAVQFVLVFGVVLSNVLDVTGVLSAPGVYPSLAALVVGQSVETWRDYFLGSEYADASPYSVVETPARRAFFLTAVLVGMPFIVAFGPGGVFVVLVAGKLLVEWSGYRADRDGGGRLTAWLSGPDADEGDARDPVSVPDADPDARVGTDDRAAVVTGLLYVLSRNAPFLAIPFLIVMLLTLTGLEGVVSPLLAIGSSLLVAVLYVTLLVAEVLEFYLQYGPIEYRRYGDRLVAVDTLVDEPQWETSIDVLRDVRVRQDRLADRLLGTRTVAVTTGVDDGSRERSLGPVADPDALVAAFDLPVRTTDLEPLGRLPAAVVIVTLCGVAGALVVLALDPSVALGGLLFRVLFYGVFGLPIGAILLRLIWDRSYPEPRD